MYHAGWAWAGSTPFKGTKLLGAYFGGTRNPLVVSWPRQIRADQTVRQQFHHVVDIAPTIYEILKIRHPRVVHGYEQMPIDGVSFAYTFDQPTAPSKKEVQFFDNNGSRAIYKDGWMACTFGPFIPWDTPGLRATPGKVGFGGGHVGALRLERRLLAGGQPSGETSGEVGCTEG